MSRLQFEYDSPYIKIYSQKRSYCKGVQEVKEETAAEVKTVKEPPGLPKQKPIKTITNITDDVVNAYIKENPETVTNHLRNGRVMKTQRKQMNARSLLNNAFLNDFILFHIKYSNQTWRIRRN